MSSLNIHDSGSPAPSVNPTANSNTDALTEEILQKANLLLQQYNLSKKGGSKTASEVGGTTSADVSTTVDIESSDSPTSVQADTNRIESNNPKLPNTENNTVSKTSQTGGTLPSGSQGTGNVWLKPPLLSAILFSVIMQADEKMMEAKLFEGLQGAKLMVSGAQAAIAEGNAIVEKAKLEAVEHIISAAIAFGTAATTVGLMAYSNTSEARANKTVNKEMDNELATANDNPKCVIDRKGTALPGSTDPVEGDIETYVQNKKTLQSGVDPDTGKPLTDKQIANLEAQNEEIKPGQAQIQEWRDHNLGKFEGPADISSDVDNIEAENQVTIDQLSDPKQRADIKARRTVDKTAEYRNQATQLSTVMSESLKGVDEVTKGVIKLMEAGYDQQRVLIQNEQGNIRNLMETASSAQKEIGDTITSFVKWLMQYSQSETQRFRFTR